MFRKPMPLGLLFALVSLALTSAGQGSSSKSKHSKPKILGSLLTGKVNAPN